MNGRVKIDEDLLIKYSKKIWIDPELPFRMQKTQLFQRLGFPVKKTIPIPIKEEDRIKRVFAEFLEKELPFLIVTSLKPMPTWIPPLFRINPPGVVTYRDIYGEIEPIKPEEIFIRIREFPPRSWVEFTKNIWGGSTIAGRLLYASAEEQILEIQRGVEIPELDNLPKNSPYLSIQLSFFEPSNYRNYRELVFQSGFKLWEVQEIIKSLQRYIQGFEGLREICPFPALEFGYTKEEKLLVIDVDWPRQYKIE